MITCLNGADHVNDHALTTWLSCTHDVPQEAIIKELSRIESRNYQAKIMGLSCEESCCSAGNNQAPEQAGITWVSGNCQADEQGGFTQLSWQ